MAIIKCPECNNDISDTSNNCIHCGYKLKNNGSGNNTKIIVIIVVTILLIIGVVLGIIISINKANDAKKQRDLEAAERRRIREEKKRAEEYYDELKGISYDILTVAAETESCGNLITQVWRNTIWEENDPETDAYTQVNGVFYDDFNDALGVLFNSETYSGYTSKIKETKNDVSTRMTKMKNPPEEYEDAYDALKDFYDEFLSFSTYCLNPTGSYNSYSSGFANSDSSMMNYYSKLEPYLKQ